MLFSDDVVPVVHPHGGTQPIIGSNPLAWAVPTSGDPFLTDFTPCATLPTYVRYSRRYNTPLAEGLVTDADGRPTTDPLKVAVGISHSLETGAINPGGQKGFGMLLMIDFLEWCLVGADMGMDHIKKEHPTKGHLFIAIDPNMFGDITTFKNAVTARMEAICSSKKCPGADAICMPGEAASAVATHSSGARCKSIACAGWTVLHWLKNPDIAPPHWRSARSGGLALAA